MLLPGLFALAEIMTVCSHDKTEKKGAQEHLSGMDVKSECMCLLLLGFGYWVFLDLAIAFILINNNP